MIELRELCMADSVSGRESEVGKIIETLAKKYCENVYIDPLGNVIAEKMGKDRPSSKIMFSAHMDEVGFIVKWINEDGTCSFDCIGGIDTAVLAGKRARLCKNGAIGVITSPPVHLSPKESRDKPYDMDALSISFPQDSSVEIGDVATFAAEYICENGYVLSKAIDDRFGCLTLLHMMSQELPYDITFAFTVQEEIGCRGAAAAAFTVRPNISVVIEATTAADIPSVSGGKRVCELGSGPVVSFMDGGTVYDKGLYKLIRDMGDRLGIPNQTKTAIAGGNDSQRIQISAGGARAAAISLPCRYLHSPSCVVKEEDMKNTMRLCTEIVGILGQEG